MAAAGCCWLLRLLHCAAVLWLRCGCSSCWLLCAVAACVAWLRLWQQRLLSGYFPFFFFSLLLWLLGYLVAVTWAASWLACAAGYPPSAVLLILFFFFSALSLSDCCSSLATACATPLRPVLVRCVHADPATVAATCCGCSLLLHCCLAGLFCNQKL